MNASDDILPRVDVQLEVRPEQPAAVEAALAELLAREPQTPDPWWQAGIEDALRT